MGGNASWHTISFRGLPNAGCTHARRDASNSCVRLLRTIGLVQLGLMLTLPCEASHGLLELGSSHSLLTVVDGWIVG